MADKRKQSIEDILAACRNADGGGAANSGDVPDAGDSPSAAADTSSISASPADSGPAKEARSMSVEEMLAAARGKKAAGEKAAGKSPQAGGAEKPSPSTAGSGKSAGEMSVAEMLAAARAGKAKPAGEEPAAKKPAAKPAPKASSAAPKGAAPKVDAGPKDTASILAMARKEQKPGPVSKAEAAAQGKPVAPKIKMPEMPERPVFAATAGAASAASSEDRRSFFGSFVGAFLGSSLAVGFSSLAVTHILWVLGLARFMFPNILTEPPTVFKVGFPDEYGPGQVQAKYKAQFGVWVVRAEYEGTTQIYALKAVCTHLGCTPNWLEGEQKFKCPCHGSGFYKDGVNFEGPAPRPLERYSIRLADDGQLEVDKSRTFQEELGQWGDAASFVPV